MADAALPPMLLPEEVAALRQRVAQLEAALTAQQHGEQTLRDAKDAAEQIVETVREPLLVLTPDFRVQSANPAFYQLFQVRPAETEGQRIYQLGNGQWDIPALHTLLEEILPQNTVFNDYEVTHDFEHIGVPTVLEQKTTICCKSLYSLSLYPYEFPTRRATRAPSSSRVAPVFQTARSDRRPWRFRA